MGIPSAHRQRYVSQLAALATEGQAILDGVKKESHLRANWIYQSREVEEVAVLDASPARQWQARAAQTLHSIIPPDSPHRPLVDALKLVSHIDPYVFQSRFDRFLAAKRDFEEGFLDDSWLLIRADVAADYLEQAQTLFEAEYHVAAAVLSGGVLEDALRKLCVANGIPTEKPNEERKSISSMNDDLANKGVYDRAKQDEIRAWAKHRNDAAHGDGGKVRSDDVGRMLDGVRAFVGDYMR